MTGGTWEAPIVRTIRRIPFIPLESEVDALIAGCGKKVSVFLQLLKETGMRCGEAWNLKWTDIDMVNQTVRVEPEKGSEPRIFKVSNNFINMLNCLEKNRERIFGYGSVNYLRRTFQRQRKRLAYKFGNPRLLQITLHTLRHWKATMEYHKTKDILHVMRVLGHKNIKNTLLYVQLEEALFKEESDGFVCKVAHDIEEAKTLIEAGFEYVCEVEGLKLFRKRK